jgi:hypothetical protein
MSQALARVRTVPGIPVGFFAEALLLLAVGLVFAQRTPDLPVLRQAMTLSEVAFLGSAGMWLMMLVVLRPRVNVYSAGLVVPFLLYILAALLSLYFSPYDMRDIDGLRELLARVYLMVFLLALASYGVAASSYTRMLMAWGIAAAVVVTLLAIFLTGTTVINLQDYEGRFIALFRNPNAAGGALSGTVLCFLPVALSRGPGHSLTTFRTLTRVTLPGLLLAVYLSDSQGAYLALLVGLMAWPVVRMSRNWGPSLALLVMVVAVPLIVAIAEVEAVARTVEEGLGLIGYEAGGRKFMARVDMIESRLRAIMMHPLTGVGLSKATLSHDPLSPIAAHGSHFTFLGITLETGLLGLAAVGTIFLTYLGILRANARLPLGGYPAWRGVNEGLTIAFIGFIIFGLTHDVQTNRTMWLVAALAVCFRPAFESESREVPPHPMRHTRLSWIISRSRLRART